MEVFSLMAIENISVSPRRFNLTFEIANRSLINIVRLIIRVHAMRSVLSNLIQKKKKSNNFECLTCSRYFFIHIMIF